MLTDAQINEILAENGEKVVRAFDQFLSELNQKDVEMTEPLLDAFRYTFRSGGKRIRPTLVLEACKAMGGDPEKAVWFALAVEMIHTYSLIHDDLPVMDNDSMRRGQKANHIVFGEANALLAGDALLTEAFSVLTRALDAGLSAGQVVMATRVLAAAAGFTGMVGGQVMDLRSEHKTIDVDELFSISERKTGALILASIKLGLIASGTDLNEMAYEAFCKYGFDLGVIFQMVDDILDVVGDPQKLGKTTGKDFKAHKKSFMHFVSPEEGRDLVNKMTEEACAYIEPYDKNSFFVSFANYLERRES